MFPIVTMPKTFYWFSVYRIRGNCGQSNAHLETAEPQRAFLTIDSGFPLPELEEAIKGGKAFNYPYALSRVPVLFDEKTWVNASLIKIRTSTD